jgi:ankyrin repeat protein
MLYVPLQIQLFKVGQTANDGLNNAAEVPLLEREGHMGENFEKRRIFKNGTAQQVQDLLSKIDPNMEFQNSKPLHWASESGNVHAVTKLLQDSRTEVSAVNGYNRTALHLAAKEGNHEVLKLLLQKKTKGIDINAVDRQGRTALHLAAEAPVSGDVTEGRFLRCLALLLARSDLEVNKPDTYGRSAISRALRKGHKMRVQVILKHKDLQELNLDYSLVDGGQTVRESILEEYPEFEALMPEPLMENIYSPEWHICLLAAVQHGLLDMFTDILEKDKDLINYQYKEPYYCTCLELACVIKGREDFVQVILNLICDSNVRNYVSGIPLLHIAAERLNWSALKVLLNTEGFDINIKGLNDGTVLHWLALNKCREGEGSVLLDECLSLLMQSREDKINIHAEDCRGDTPLHVAIRWQNLNLALYLLGSGASVDSGNKNGHTPLHVAASSGNKDAILTLLKYGADIDAEGSRGTPLYVAAQRGKKDVVLLLLKKGAKFMCEVKGKAILQYLDPQVFEEFLDYCIESNGKNARSAEYRLTFRYNFIPSLKDKPHTATDIAAAEMQPILKMCEINELRALLKHPIISSVVFVKWCHACNVVYLNIGLYSLFLLFLTLHIIFIHNSPKECEKQAFNQSLHLDSSADSYGIILLIVRMVTTIILGILLCLIMVRESIKLIVDKTEYLCNPENFFEASVIVSTFIYVVVPHVNINHHAASIAILLAWIEFLFLLGNLPSVSVQLELLKKVFLTILKFGLCYIPIILAFALSFNVLFSEKGSMDEDAYITEGIWKKARRAFLFIFQTFIMFAGEFEAKGFSFYSVPVTSHLIFLVFLLLVALTLLNLLNGLAVSDTRVIIEDAEIVSLVARVKLVYKTEETVLRCQQYKYLKQITQRCCFLFGDLPLKCLYVFPNVNYKICHIPGCEGKGKMDSAITESAILIDKRDMSHT